MPRHIGRRHRHPFPSCLGYHRLACSGVLGRVSPGYAIITGDWGEVKEYDTLTCPHCNGVSIIRPGSGTKRGFCFRCDKPTCGKEPCLNCIPFERKLEEMEGRYRLRKALDRV